MEYLIVIILTINLRIYLYHIDAQRLTSNNIKYDLYFLDEFA